MTQRDRPSPRFDINAGNGMAVSIGRVENAQLWASSYSHSDTTPFEVQLVQPSSTVSCLLKRLCRSKLNERR